VRGYKSAVTYRINAARQERGSPIWQRNYYEHVIRNDAELSRIRLYIQTNPLRWEADQLQPAASPNRFNRGH
jgi:REP element-mobilizing transposase RayT